MLNILYDLDNNINLYVVNKTNIKIYIYIYTLTLFKYSQQSKETYQENIEIYYLISYQDKCIHIISYQFSKVLSKSKMRTISCFTFKLRTMTLITK